MKNMRLMPSAFLLALGAFISWPLTTAYAQVPPVPPVVTKNFDPNSINAYGSARLTITVTNNNASEATLLSVSDFLPFNVTLTGVVESNTCGGILSAPAGDDIVTLSGGAIAANSSCAFAVDVTAIVPGTYINTIPIPPSVVGGVQYSILVGTELVAVTNIAAAVDTLVVPSNPPVVAKQFTPASISPTGFALLTINITNNNGVPATALSVTDNLPAGLTIANPAGATNTCGGTLTATSGSSSVTLTNGTIAAGTLLGPGFCTITLNVTATTPGVYVNTISAGQVFYTIVETVLTGNAASATLAVVLEPPVVSKRFYPSRVDDCGCSTLVITLTNPSSLPSTLTFPFADNLPAGLDAVSRPATTCLNGVATLYHSQLTLQSGTIPANSSCTVSVEVASHCNGEFINRIPAGALRTSTGNNLDPAFARVEFCCEDHEVAREMCHAVETIDEEEGMSLDDRK
jgi:hypothetical protein